MGRRLMLAALLPVLASCGASRLPPLVEYGTPSIHAVADDRLRDTMNRLHALAYEQIPSALELEHERERVTSGFADDMAALADSVKNLPLEEKLPPEARPVFLGLGDRLRRQAQELKADARAGDSGAIRPTLDRIIQTCNDCHSRFRGPREEVK